MVACVEASGWALLTSVKNASQLQAKIGSAITVTISVTMSLLTIVFISIHLIDSSPAFPGLGVTIAAASGAACGDKAYASHTIHGHLRARGHR